MSTANLTLSGGLKATIFTLSFLMLGVSTYHASIFMLKMSEDIFQQAAMVLTAVALLASSHALARLAGASMAQSRAVLAISCIVCIIALELFSVATSAASLSNRAISATRSENLASPEYKMAMQNVANYQSQISQLRANANSLPSNYVTKRNQIQDKISQLQGRLESAQQRANNVNVSTTGKALSGIESRYGITSSDVAMTASIMLSVTPMIMGIAVGALGARKQKAQPVKKQKPNLRAVA